MKFGILNLTCFIIVALMMVPNIIYALRKAGEENRCRSKAALKHMTKGGAIINTASINADLPNPTLLAYATTKGAVYNLTAGLAQALAPRGIRVNAVAPGPIWTPLIPSTLPPEAVKAFGKSGPMGRPGQPAELATAYVMLAEPRSSYVSGATIAVTGGEPFL